MPSYFINTNQKGSTSGVKTFANKKVFFDTLLAITKQSDKVYTCMYSDPPVKLGKSGENYFNTVHKILRGNFGVLKFEEFKRIATVDTKEKANWLLGILFDLHKSAAFSLVIQYVENSNSMVSIHNCFGSNGRSLMLWHTMKSDPSGVALLVNDLEAARIWKEKYMLEFNKSIPLKLGVEMNWNNIHDMAEKYKLLDSEVYKKLINL